MQGAVKFGCTLPHPPIRSLVCLVGVGIFKFYTSFLNICWTHIRVPPGVQKYLQRGRLCFCFINYKALMKVFSFPHEAFSKNFRFFPDGVQLLPHSPWQGGALQGGGFVSGRLGISVLSLPP